MVSGGPLSFRHAEMPVLTHERKLKKHEAKLSASNIFFSVSKYL